MGTSELLFQIGELTTPPRDYVVEPERHVANQVCMTLQPERIAILMARCSNGACDLLRDLQRHETFPELVGRLETLRGTIYQIDVEKHLFELLKNRQELTASSETLGLINRLKSP